MLCLEGLFSMLDGTRAKAGRTFFNCYHCRMRSGGTGTSKIMQPLESVERAVYTRNRLGWIEQILKKQSTMDGLYRKRGNDTQDFCGKIPPSVKSRCVIKGGTRSPGWENCGLQLIQQRRNLVRKLVRCQPEICTKNVWKRAKTERKQTTDNNSANTRTL